MNKKAFTLTEVLITVIIIGILLGLSIPQYFKSVERGRQAEAYQVLAELRNAAIRYYNEFTEWPDEITDTDFDALDYEVGTDPDDLDNQYRAKYFDYAYNDPDNITGADSHLVLAQRIEDIHNYGQYYINMQVDGDFDKDATAP